MARVLVIDDNDVVRAVCERALAIDGHTVALAQDGREGIRYLAEHPIDLVICDLFMPEKDGFETIQEIAAAWPAVKIIAMSGGGFAGTLDLLDQAVGLGAARALPKPFSVGELRAAVRSALEGAGG